MPRMPAMSILSRPSPNLFTRENQSCDTRFRKLRTPLDSCAPSTVSGPPRDRCMQRRQQPDAGEWGAVGLPPQRTRRPPALFSGRQGVREAIIRRAAKGIGADLVVVKANRDLEAARDHSESTLECMTGVVDCSVLFI